jgi:chromosome segregation ATPase
MPPPWTLEKAALEKLKVTQTDISKQYEDQKTKLADLKTQLDTTRKDALKPFQDQLDEVGRHAELLKLDEKLELDPLRKKIHDLQEPAEKSYGAIIAGMQGSLDLIGKLNPKLDDATKVYNAEVAAQTAAQKNYDQATAALTQQQKYFDNLKIGLDDLKIKLTESKNIWGDLQMLIAAINTANGIGNTGGMIWPAGTIHTASRGGGRRSRLRCQCDQRCARKGWQSTCRSGSVHY